MTGARSPEPQAAGATRDRFVAAAVTRLRDPLHAIAGLAELLHGADLSVEARRHLDSMRHELADLSVSLDEMIDAARLTSGRLTLAPRSEDVRRLVDEALRRSGQGRRAADIKGEVTTKVDAAVPKSVVLDGPRWVQITAELVRNALRHAPGGRVALRVQYVKAHDADDVPTLVLTVTDEGPGIPVAEQAHLFDPFFVGSAAGEQGPAGTGLGLYVVRGIAELMGGRVTVASRAGAGSTFTLVVPVDVDTASTPGADAAPVSLLDVPVLVVDDEEVNRLLATAQLSRLGMRAVAVATGEEAVQLLSKGNGPDLVLMDLWLPGIDGDEATRRIRAAEATHGRRAVVIGVTASTSTDDRVRAEEAGMDDFLPKPVSLSALAGTLGRWVEGGVRVPGTRGAEQVVDASVLDDLVGDLGSLDAVLQLVRTYVDEMQGRRRKLADAAAANDLAAARHVAHTLRSGSLLLGARSLGALCDRILAATEVAEAKVLIDQALQQSTAVARWLQVWLSQHH